MRGFSALLIGALVVAALVVAPTPARAQIEQTLAITAQDAGNCATAGACAVISMGSMPVAAIDVSGTFSATLTAVCSVLGGTFRTVTVAKADLTTTSTTTGTGIFYFPNPGYDKCGFEATAYTSGTASVYGKRGYASARVLTTTPTFVTSTATTAYRGPDGDCTTPGYGFTSETTTGFSRPSTGAIRACGNQTLWTASSAGFVSNFGILTNHPTQGMGYKTGDGAGGTVTQGTSKSTAVTLNKISGGITMNAAALASGAKVSFVVNDSAVAAVDAPIVAVASGGTANAYRAVVTAVASQAFTVTVENITAGSLSEAPVINFAVFKGTQN